MEILTFNAKLNYVISNTVVVFILYLLFAFSNVDSVILEWLFGGVYLLMCFCDYFDVCLFFLFFLLYFYNYCHYVAFMSPILLESL
jgi:hypothetical protein